MEQLVICVCIGLVIIGVYLLASKKTVVRHKVTDKAFVFIVKNGAEWIEGLVRSLGSIFFLERFGPFNIVVADNYSDDETSAILYKLAKEFSNVTIVTLGEALVYSVGNHDKEQIFYFELDSDTNFLKLVDGLTMVLGGDKTFEDFSSSMEGKKGGVVACWVDEATDFAYHQREPLGK